MVKINNFTELDRVLQKSFSAIRKDIDKIKKNTESRVDDIKRGSVHEKTMGDTKVKFLTSEIRKLKDAHADLLSLQKAQIDKLDNVNKKHADELKHHLSQELSKTEVETDRLKNDIVKLVSMLKDKMVTRKLFDERNKVYDNNLCELLDVSKEIKDFKVNARLQVDKQLSNTKEDIDVLKEEIASINEELGELRTTAQSISGLRMELSEYVGKDEFSQKLALFDKMSTSVEKIDQTLSELTELKEQVQGAGKIREDIDSVKSQLESELTSVRDAMLARSDLDEVRAKVDTLQSMVSKVDEIEEAVKKAGKTEQDIEDLKDELLALPELSKEFEKLKKDNDKLSLKVDTQQVKLELLDATTPKRKEEKGKKMEEKNEPELLIEQKPEDLQDTEQPNEQGFFSKTLKGIADFFIEDEEVQTAQNSPIMEQTEEVKSEVKEEKKDNELFIKNIEKIFDEEEPYTFEGGLQPEITTQKAGFFTRIRSGVVNFLFEEVDDTEVVPETQPVAQEGLTGTSVVAETQLDEPVSKAVPALVKSKPKKAKRIQKKREIKETKEGKEEPQYMLNKKPHVFEEEDGAGETEENGKKRKYKKIKGDDPLAEFAEEEVLYPEDYFY